MRKSWQLVALMVLVVVAALGLGRIRFETDPLAVLPGDLPEVEGLKAFQEGFSRDEELVLLLEGDGELEERAEELAERLIDAGVSDSVRWRPQWRDDPGGMAELFAWLWLNADSEDLAQLRESLREEEIEGTLQDALERIATSVDGGEMVLSAH
ncbi:MAG: hypothetical protein ACPG4K_01450, partial [Haloferula sp.]